MSVWYYIHWLCKATFKPDFSCKFPINAEKLKLLIFICARCILNC